jgi:ligand-binding sensor domain-containing protein/anti-sigma regulatory factor (Ser/Thr protein kinase)
MRYAIIILCCYTNVLFAQNGFRTVNMYTTQNGLSDNTIYCICQDSRGFLWLGTQEGLNRFDGYRFKKFFADKTGLAGNTITDILEYQRGYLLIATSKGLSVLNTFNSNFENEKIKFEEVKAGSGTLINSLYKDKAGNIWVNHNGELDIFDSNLQYRYRFTDLRWARDLKGIKIVYDWFTDKQNRLWLPSDTTGIQVIDFAQKKIWNNHNNPQQDEFFKPQFIRSAFLDESANTLWYAPWGSGVFKYDLNTHTQQQQNFGSNAVDELHSVNAITQTEDGKILCSRGLDLFVVDAVSLQYQKLSLEVPGLPGKYIETPVVFSAGNGCCWMGTNYGLLKMEKAEALSKKFNFIKAEKKIPPGECTGIAFSFGKIYCSFFNNRIVETEQQPGGYHVYSIPGKKNPNLTLVKEYKDRRLWIGTTKGLYQFNATTKTFNQPEGLHQDLYKAQINFIFYDQDSTIWINTRNPFGIYRYAPSTGSCKKISNTVTAYFETLGQGSRISSISEDDDKKLWMVSRLGGGVICHDRSSGQWSIYPKQNKHRNLITKGLAYVHADAYNNLWFFDDYGSGLIQYNYLSDSISYITRKQGMPSDMVRSVTSDNAGNLWILTDYGISRFDLKKQKITATGFFQARLISPDRLTYNASSNSLACIAGDGVFVYPIAQLLSQKKELMHPIIDKVWVNNREIIADVNGEHLELKPGQTNVSIDFTVVHYSNADKIRFAYELSGADHDWKYADASRSAQYAVLTPGTYTFRIKVADENGNWNEPYDSFSFTIVPWFWQTLTFKILLVLVVSGIVFYFVRKRIKTVRQEAELKQKMTETEMMALRAQMNPHFIFNCISAIDNLVQSDQKEKATVYLTRFAKLIRSVLDNSKNNLVPFYKDYESLQLFLQLEKFRCNDKFEYRISADEEILNSDIKVPPLIIQPFVENAIHHGLMNKREPDRELSIRAQLEKDYLKYTITDNGVGREIAEVLQQMNKPEHVSYGLDISSKRVNLHNKNNGAHPGVVITDLKNGDVPAGTKVELWLSLK